MLSSKSVLPNFAKSIVIASMAIASVSAYAGQHEEGEKKIGDLKDMSSEAAQLQAEDMTDEAEAAAVKDAMTDEAKKMMDGKADKMAGKALEGVEPN